MTVSDSRVEKITVPQALQIGEAHLRAGRLQEAEHFYSLVLRTQPDNTEALHRLGLVRQGHGDLEGAAELIRRAIGLTPAFPEAHNDLGVILQSQDRSEEALSCYRKAVALRPEYAEAHHNIGALLQRQGSHEQALVHCERSVALNPQSADLHLNLAHALHGLGRTEDAIASARRAIALRPNDHRLYNDLGTLLASLGRWDEAAASYGACLERKPDFHPAHNNLGFVLQKLRSFDAAVRSFRVALELKPDYFEARANLGFLLLLLGRMEEGWREFEWRNLPEARNMAQNSVWRNRPHDFAQPLWRGESLADKTLLLSVEFGYGDTIQFCRYAASIASSGVRVILEVQRPLLRLLSQLPVQVVAHGDPLPAFDYYCPLMSAPQRVGTTLDNIPAPVPYLRADAARAAAWAERLASYPGRRVGLAWSGNPTLVHDRERSILFEQLAPLIAMSGIQFVSLQKDAAADQLRCATGERVLDWTSDLRDFADTAALVANLDLVISVDTAVVHLAGAMGKPIWLLNRYDPCWRWLLDRDDSPWYPGLRQFRQPRAGDWSSVVSDVRAALAHWCCS